MDRSEPRPKLRQVQFTTADGKAFSAFVALTDEQWIDFLADDEPSLAPYKEHVLLVVRGEASEADQRAAAGAFRHLYTDMVIRDDPAKDAYRTGMCCLEGADYDLAINAFTEAIRA